MSILVTIIHVIVCLFLVIVVLLQSGKAADIAGAFGGMGSQTVFGPRGSATLLSRLTTIAAALFMVTSLSLSVISTRNGASRGPAIFNKAVPAQSAPAAPASSTPAATPATTPAPAAAPAATPAPAAAPATDQKK
jgi:preprotein translocase subunit SecG